jgi:predicted dithiol-disulfide oxidoreductase (DUF899 family)
MTTTHATATREHWLAARLDLLEAEKELTRRSDELARRAGAALGPRREVLPLRDGGRPGVARRPLRRRSQLLVYHFMFGPDFTGGCPSCSAIADGFNGSVVHLEHHDVAMVAVSRAPIAALEAYKRRMGWTFTWASSRDTDFNYDFNTSVTEAQQRSGSFDYNYRDVDTTWLEHVDPSSTVAQHAAMAGTDAATFTREAPGMSAFAFEDGVVYHTYSAYARGLDGLWGMYQWLDRAPKGATRPAGRGGGGATSTRPGGGHAAAARCVCARASPRAGRGTSRAPRSTR